MCKPRRGHSDTPRPSRCSLPASATPPLLPQGDHPQPPPLSSPPALRPARDGPKRPPPPNNAAAVSIATAWPRLLKGQQPRSGVWWWGAHSPRRKGPNRYKFDPVFYWGCARGGGVGGWVGSGPQYSIIPPQPTSAPPSQCVCVGVQQGEPAPSTRCWRRAPCLSAALSPSHKEMHSTKGWGEGGCQGQQGLPECRGCWKLGVPRKTGGEVVLGKALGAVPTAPAGAIDPQKGDRGASMRQLVTPKSEGTKAGITYRVPTWGAHSGAPQPCTPGGRFTAKQTTQSWTPRA